MTSSAYADLFTFDSTGSDSTMATGQVTDSMTGLSSTLSASTDTGVIRFDTGGNNFVFREDAEGGTGTFSFSFSNPIVLKELNFTSISDEGTQIGNFTVTSNGSTTSPDLASGSLINNGSLTETFTGSGIFEEPGTSQGESTFSFNPNTNVTGFSFELVGLTTASAPTNGNSGVLTIHAQVVPEPGSAFLLTIAGVAGLARRRR